MAEPRMIEDAWRASKEGGNNFDALRLAAAALVVVSHSFILGTGRHEREFIPALAGGAGLGEIAVFIFFSVSGFLVTKSWLAEPTLHRYFLKRATRILPALAFAVVSLSFFLGPLLTTKSLSDYFFSGESWAFLLNIVFMSQHATLPGVFDANPLPGRVDNSLWTLGFEAFCYLAIATFGMLRILRWQNLALVALLLLAVGTIAGLREAGSIGDSVFKMSLVGPHFFVGAAAACRSDRIPLSAPLALGSAAALVLASVFGGFVFAFSIFGGYLVLYFAFARLGFVKRAGRFGDFSYGVYLWGWPAQQIVQSVISPEGWVGNLMFGLPLTLVFAVISWKLVEQPAIALKARLRADRAPGAPLNFRKWGKGEPKALPPRADAAIRIQNHD